MPSLGLRLFSSAWFRDFAWNLTYSGYVLCSQQMTVITPDEFEDYSLELLVEPVRGANSSTERHNIAAHTLQTIIGGLDRVLCAMYARRPNPDADVPPLDRHHNGGRRGGEVQQESKVQFQLQKASFNFSSQNQIKSE